MARPVSDEELQLKKRARRRLVGAVVLVTAAAVILPMVLDTEPRSFNQNVDIHIPSPDSGEFKPKATETKPVTPAPKAETAAPAPAAKSEPPVVAAKPPSSPTSPFANPIPPPPDGPVEAIREPETRSASSDAAKDVKKTAPKEPSAKEAAAKETAPKESPKATAAGAYVVQVAALSDSAKAKQLEKQMAGAGVKTYTEVVNTQAGEVTRVRAGPYATREAAEKARTQLKKAGLDGKVVPK